MTEWSSNAIRYLNGLLDAETSGYRSTPGGVATTYGTSYAALALDYLGVEPKHLQYSMQFLRNAQDPQTGWYTGPELPGANDRRRHNLEHLSHHLTCTVIPALAQFDCKPNHPLKEAHKYLDIQFLREWLEQRDLSDAWFEGNNLLFVGQLLLHIRDIEGLAEASSALELWFDWHDKNLDPRTGVWGTDQGSSVRGGVYGGYHQLILYYAEDREIKYSEALVNSVLALQHADGGFSNTRGGGACEDADAVDILVNMYKRHDYRRPEIRVALRKCMYRILATQNHDGGFSYKQCSPYTHMGMELTRNPTGVSGAFPTWFRVHTLGLIRQVLLDEAQLSDVEIGFSHCVSMGWHNPCTLAPLALPTCYQAEEARVKKWQVLTHAPKNLGAFSELPIRRMRKVASKFKHILIRR